MIPQEELILPLNWFLRGIKSSVWKFLSDFRKRDGTCTRWKVYSSFLIWCFKGNGRLYSTLDPTRFLFGSYPPWPLLKGPLHTVMPKNYHNLILSPHFTGRLWWFSASPSWQRTPPTRSLLASTKAARVGSRSRHSWAVSSRLGRPLAAQKPAMSEDM